MIKRYYATKDNTITNAYSLELPSSSSLRATGSNMGASDILEVFSIYGATVSGSGLSRELSRIVIQFDLENLKADRNNNLVPSGSSYYIKLFNAPHVYTTPQDFKMSVFPVPGNDGWQEGFGLNMNNYGDLTYDVTGSNWIKRAAANSWEHTGAVATHFASITTLEVTGAAPASGSNFTLYNTAGTGYIFGFDSTQGYGAIGDNYGKDTSKFIIPTNMTGATISDIRDRIRLSIMSASGSITANSGSTSAKLNLVQDVGGTAGSRAIAVTGAVQTETPRFNGGGTYKSFDQYFKTGEEDLEINITTQVNAWLANPATHAGLVVKLSASYENEDRSYYTKKFYSRSTSNFFKKPFLEARWNSSRQDDRGDFYTNSPALPSGYNINTLYFYNYARGNLVAMPDLESDTLYVDLYDAPGGNRVSQYSAMGTGSMVSTGVYKVKLRVDTTASILYDVWHNGWGAGTRVIYHTGTLNIKTHKESEVTNTSNYVLSVSNKNQSYYYDQTHRIRVYARYKNWSPSIYTTATTVPASLNFQSASYQVYRAVDDRVVIPYGTGSAQATCLSYDISGNYFDLDMSILEPNYTYGVKFSVYDPDTTTYEEQPYTYKFRVVKNEY